MQNCVEKIGGKFVGQNWVDILGGKFGWKFGGKLVEESLLFFFSSQKICGKIC